MELGAWKKMSFSGAMALSSVSWAHAICSVGVGVLEEWLDMKEYIATGIWCSSGASSVDSICDLSKQTLPGHHSSHEELSKDPSGQNVFYFHIGA